MTIYEMRNAVSTLVIALYASRKAKSKYNKSL